MEEETVGSTLWIAGVGASAGGLESLERFFRNVPADSGIAFIVVQHLSADHKSLMEELIGRFAAVPVSMAKDGDELVPNHIYLLSPGTEVEVHGNHLAVFPRNSERALAFPVDRMLTSLAESHQASSIAVILSGSGSDGSRGVRRIDSVGGLVMVEDPALAAFDGMPQSAIDTGTAVAVMSAESLAQAMCEHASTGVLPESLEKSAVEGIILLLKRSLGADFEEYKRGTIYRRATRRARMANVDDLRGYLRLLEGSPTELAALQADLLIGVTSFFRNPDWFEHLSRQIDEIVSSAIEPERELRAWCAGCASGEEAYSIAILFDEAIRRAGSRRTFKVFATDVHRGALESAGVGAFGLQQLAHVSEARMAEYFVERGDGKFQISSALRHKVVFAHHDLLKDTPFTNLDVVCCRNLLIYLGLPAQRRALASLSYGLRLGGILFLGSSESPGGLTAQFDTINETAKLYKKRVHARGNRRPEIPSRVLRPGAIQSEQTRPESRLLSMYDALLDRFMPPSFLLNEQRTLLDSFGDADRLLRVSKRRPSGDFLELVPQSARTALSGLMAAAQRKAGTDTSLLVSWAHDGDPVRHFRARVQRLDTRHAEPVYLVSLVESADAPATGPEEPGGAEAGARTNRVGERTAHLEDELAHARVTLQVTVEELEASNEELQATNEELVASNEELQSVNEELHSVNEELHTVNAEHQLKIAELTELNRDIGHLLESIDVSTVYLDNQLRIRKYTPRAAIIFGLMEHDVGRYLASFNNQLHYPALMNDVKSVLDSGEVVEKEVRGRDERWYFARLLPYRIVGEIEGVVVTLTDATALAAAKARAHQLSSIVESSGDAIIGMALDGTIQSWNAATTRLYGYSADEMVGQSIMQLVPEKERNEMRRLLAEIASGKDLINIDAVRISKSGVQLDVAKTMSPVRDSEGVVVGIATIDRDVRVQKDLERRLRESERRYHDLYDNAPDLYITIDTRSGRVLECNETFVRATGFSREALQGMHVLDLYPSAAQDAAREALGRLREGEAINDFSLQVRRQDEADLDVTMSATAVYAPNGDVVAARVVLHDVSTRRLAELELQRAGEMREQFLAMVSHELRTPLHAINAALQIIDQPQASESTRQRSNAVLRRQTRQMTRLVDDLLDVSRIINGKLHLERVPMDLGDVARGALDAVAPAFHSKGVKLITDGFEPALPSFGDPGRIEQVLGNLLNNSLRYTQPGRSVHVSCKVEDRRCQISVKDEGRGIEREDLQTIFNIFVQSRQGLARREGGLGLGLTIAERIVVAHGGTISAHSDGLGRGATFTVELALDPGAADVTPAQSVTEGGLSIVIVEDQEDARDMLQELLELDGHDVKSARDAEEGLSTILEFRPQVCLLDIGLPGMNGYELAKVLRERLGGSVKLVAMSGYGQPGDVQAAEAAGFDRHVTKPVDGSRLSNVLAEVTAGRTDLWRAPDSQSPHRTPKGDDA